MRKPNLKTLTFERLPFPEDIIVETCAFCNLKCIMCPYPIMKRPRGEMKFEVFAKIVDEMAKENPNGRLWVAIMGEPLLGKKLIRMLHYAKDKALANVHLNTNATFLTPEVTHKLLDAGLNKLLISLDAHTKTTYDKIRRGGDFPLVLENINYFLQEKSRRGLKRPDIVAQFIVMNENEQEVEAFKRYWLDRGVIVKIRLKMGWGRAVATEDLDEASVERVFPCPWILRAVSIHWNGKFAQCDADYDGEQSPGDINHQTIKEVWMGELADRIAKHWALDFSHPLCRTCKDWAVGRAEFYYPENYE